MQVKKYTASNMQEAIKMIKEDLGSKAVIISTRKIRKGTGAFGMFGKQVLEVTAARDNSIRQTPPPDYGALARQQRPKTSEYEIEISQNTPQYPRKTAAVNDQAVMKEIQNDVLELKELVTDLRRGHRREVNDGANVAHLRYELSELKNLISSLVNQSSLLREDDLHENLIALFQQLCFNGVEDRFARKLIQEVRKKIPKQEVDNFPYVKIYVARMFMQVLGIMPSPTSRGKNEGPRVLTFLGPTGVGKTTTLAKIAGKMKLSKADLKIGLLTLDTFRIAAVQQLQEYARIINAPLRVVNDRNQLEHALEEYHQKDLILIDTAGRSQRDEMQMAELREVLSPYQDFRNLLVLSATTKDGDLIEITKRFSQIPLSGVIFTKLDESTNYGSIFNHAIRFKLPLTYLTTGQNVPDDIEKATRDRLIDLLLNISSMDH
jgi:flagellar biosynthesis protein FlhF